MCETGFILWILGGVFVSALTTALLIIVLAGGKGKI